MRNKDRRKKGIINATLKYATEIRIEKIRSYTL